MRLYFLRHGIAEDVDDANGNDEQRKLTPKGVERMEAGAHAMARLGVKPAHIYSSPLVRALQTADIVGKAIGVEVESEPGVGPGFSPQIVDSLLSRLNGDGDVLFVGHEPSMSRVVSALIGGGTVTMKKGSLARLDTYGRAPLRCSLVWLIAPAVFVLDGDDSD